MSGPEDKTTSPSSTPPCETDGNKPKTPKFTIKSLETSLVGLLTTPRSKPKVAAKETAPAAAEPSGSPSSGAPGTEPKASEQQQAAKETAISLPPLPATAGASINVDSVPGGSGASSSSSDNSMKFQLPLCSYCFCEAHKILAHDGVNIQIVQQPRSFVFDPTSKTIYITALPVAIDNSSRLTDLLKTPKANAPTSSAAIPKQSSYASTESVASGKSSSSMSSTGSQKSDIVAIESGQLQQSSRGSQLESSASKAGSKLSETKSGMPSKSSNIESTASIESDDSVVAAAESGVESYRVYDVDDEDDNGKTSGKSNKAKEQQDSIKDKFTMGEGKSAKRSVKK